MQFYFQGSQKLDIRVAISRLDIIAQTQLTQGCVCVPMHGTTECPEDESNFETYVISGIGGAMRISFGLLRAGMCWFNYM